MERKRFLIPVLAFIMLLAFAQVAKANWVDYSGGWRTTDNDSNAYTAKLIIGNLIVNFNLVSGWSFGVYDIDGNNGGLVLIDSTATASTFFVDDSNVLHVTEGLSNGSTLTLSDSSGHFGFYFSNGSTMHTTYQYDSAGPVNQWLLKMADSYSAGGPVILSDVTHAPIPAAVWLLGSGLFGLVAVRRKRG